MAARPSLKSPAKPNLDSITSIPDLFIKPHFSGSEIKIVKRILIILKMSAVRKYLKFLYVAMILFILRKEIIIIFFLLLGLRTSSMR